VNLCLIPISAKEEELQLHVSLYVPPFHRVSKHSFKSIPIQQRLMQILAFQ